MTKQIKTAQAWKCKTFPLRAGVLGEHLIDGDDEPVVIVHGLTEAEVNEAAALLEKSREVCEWRYIKRARFSGHFEKCKGDYVDDMAPDFCPSCGRKVVAK